MTIERSPVANGGNPACAAAADSCCAEALCAAVLVLGGISVVAERLGCTEGNILRNYRHVIPGSDQNAAEFVDRLLNGEAGSGGGSAG